jgi:hypothetical protein
MATEPLRLFLLPAQLRIAGGVSGVRKLMGYGFEIWQQALRVGEAPKRLAGVSE